MLAQLELLQSILECSARRKRVMEYRAGSAIWKITLIMCQQRGTSSSNCGAHSVLREHLLKILKRFQISSKNLYQNLTISEHTEFVSNSTQISRRYKSSKLFISYT